MSRTRVLVRTGITLARRALWHDGRPQRGLLPVALTLIMLSAFGATFSTLFQSLADAGAPPTWAARLLGWAFTLAFVMLTLGDLHVVVAALVDSPQLDRMRLAPLSTLHMLAIETVRTLPRTLPPVLGIALPAALAHAHVYGTSVATFALPLALLTLWAVPLGLGTALALVLLRLSPAARLREAIAALATFAFIAGWLVNAFWLPRLASDSASFSAWFRALPEPPAWSPATWAAVVLDPDARTRLAAMLQCALVSLAALAAAAYAATRVLATVQSRAAGTPGRLTPGASRRASTLLLAFLRRDRALVLRDWPVLLDALASVSLWTLLPLAVLPVAPLPRLEIAREMLIALSVSLGNDLAARALPLERTSLAWARLSPVGGARWLRHRAAGLALAGGTVVLVATALTTGALGLPLAAFADVLVFATAAAASAMASGLLIGAMLGDVAWTDPRAMLGAGGRSVAAGVLLSQAALWVALAHYCSPGEPLGITALAPVLILALVHSAIVLAVGARVLERREFTHG